MNSAVIVMLGLLLASTAAASGVGGIGQGTDSWAYGASRSGSASGTLTTSMGMTSEYSMHSHGAMAVIFNQTNTTNTTFMIEGQRTVGFSYDVKFCRPSCTNPTETMTLNVTGWDHEVAFANFTRDGTVMVGGKPVQAVALENIAESARSNMTVTGSWSGGHSGSMYASVALSARYVLSFLPPLGLFPSAPYVGEQWNSSANFSGTGSWLGAYYMHTTMMGTRSGSLNGSVQKNGTVFLSGVDTGNITLSGGGRVMALLIKLWNAPFRLADGIFMMPLGADLFGGMMRMPWSGSVGGIGEGVGGGMIDVDRGAGHIGIVASQVNSSPQATMMNSTTMGGGGMGGGGMGAMDVPLDTTLPSSSLQAQPMGVADAENLAASILNPQTPGGGGSGGLHLIPLLLIALVGTVAAVGVAYYVIERRKTPRSPPGQAAYRAAMTQPVKKGATKSAGEERDPLDHLM